MKTFMNYLEGLFDKKVHTNPLGHDDFIESMHKKFSVFPINLLVPYIRARINGDENKAGNYRVDLMVAGKSYALLKALDEMIDKEIKNKKDDSEWWIKQQHTGFGQK